MNLPNMFEGNNNPNQMNFGGNNNSNNNPLGNFDFSQFGGNNQQSSNNSKEPVEIVNSFEKLNEYMETYPGLIVDFFSYTCGPCMQIKPYYEALAKEYAQKCPGLKFISVDTAKARDISGNFQIKAIPTFIGFYEGNIIKRFQGGNKQELQSLAFTLESKINSKSNKNQKQELVEEVFELKILNPKKKDLYTFKGDNYAMPIKVITDVLSKNSVLNDETAKAIFTEFAKDPAGAVKSFSNEKIDTLVNWTFETLLFLEISDKTIGFLDLLRMLTLDAKFLDSIIKQEDKVAIIFDFLDKSEKDLIEIQKGLKLVLTRLITNFLSAEKGKEFFKKNMAKICKVLLKLGEAYQADKSPFTAVMMACMNLIQLNYDTKEFGDFKADIANLIRMGFNSNSESEIMLPCLMSLGWLTFYFKDVRKEINAKIDKPKLAKLEFATDNEAVAKLSRDVSYILEGKIN